MATVDVLVSEAAKILNISASHVRYLERTGQLRARRAGQVRIFDRAEVEQLATERYRTAPKLRGSYYLLVIGALQSHKQHR
jgi:excisionase family DNA binding protein